MKDEIMQEFAKAKDDIIKGVVEELKDYFNEIFFIKKPRMSVNYQKIANIFQEILSQNESQEKGSAVHRYIFPVD